MYKPLLSLLVCLATYLCTHAQTSDASADAFLKKYQPLITARWTAPFDSASVVTNNAPAGP